MYTQCPHCQTCFRVSEAHLKAAGGRVRCGSCQEVFDASQFLYNNLTDKQPIKPASRQETLPDAAALPEHETEHIDLSATPPPAQDTGDKFYTERKTAPDQSRFMQSVVDNSRYNNLDDMGPISIPGELSFGDSFIKHPTQQAEPVPAPEPPADQPNAYEDTEGRHVATTDADRASIQSLFAAADSQVQDDEQKSRLDKDIDELLAFANNLDLDDESAAREAKNPAAPEPERENEFDMDAIAAFEEELVADQPAAQEELEEETLASEAEMAPDVPASAAANAQTERFVADRRSGADEDIPRALRRSLDSLNGAPTRSVGQTLGLLGIIILLLAGLGFQLLLFRNVELVKLAPSLTPIVASACERLPCQYAGKADVRQIKLLNRDVRSHPTQKNALLISAAFVNEAAFDQPYPSILITLSDLSGHVVASRRFTPQEYLEDMYNRFILLESGTPVHVTLAVLDPGSDAINFEFSFL